MDKYIVAYPGPGSTFPGWHILERFEHEQGTYYGLFLKSEGNLSRASELCAKLNKTES